MTLINPTGAPSFGNVSVLWVASIATPSAPKVSELTAAHPGSLDISCFLMSDGWKPEQSVSKSTAPRRLCQVSTFERITSVTQTLADLMYSFDPQSATGSTAKKAYETLTPGLSGFFVERLGLAPDSPIAAGQFVNVLPVTLGPHIPFTPTDEAGEFQAKQAVSLRAVRSDNVAVVI